MGLLSIANTVPHCIDNLITTIANIFTPRFTILYAKDNTDLLVEETKFSSKIMSFLMTAPLAGFIAFGNKFYTLWQPTKSPDEITIIQILSVLVCISYLFTCHTRTLSSLFTVCNKLKASVLISLVCGVLTVIIVLLLIHFTPLGVYAIAGVSSVFIGLKAIVFVPLYAAHILKIKLTTYYRSIFRDGSACCCYHHVHLYQQLCTRKQLDVIPSSLCSKRTGRICRFRSAHFLKKRTRSYQG